MPLKMRGSVHDRGIREFTIDRDGTIQLQWVGGISLKMLDKHVTPLIMEPQ